MDYLAVLIVEAVDRVDRRHQLAEQSETASATGVADLEAVKAAYQKGAGSWTGCDWPTHFGKSGLNLNGMDARTLLASLGEIAGAREWRAAAEWLTEVERRAHQAELLAAAAVLAAAEGRWENALHSIHRAWALEFSTGRPLRADFPLAWQALREEIEKGYLAHKANNEEAL
jgi:hypothetical protein